MRQILRTTAVAAMMALLPLCVSAQEEWSVQHGDCLPTGLPQHSAADSPSVGALHRLPAVKDLWDAERTYHQLVVLVEFEDETFQAEDPNGYYVRLFNEPGYNEGAGVGCMADYYKEQSNGLCNLQFDVYGPVTVPYKAQPYDDPDANTRNHGNSVFYEAMQQVVSNHPEMDYSPYDWDGDGVVEQVIFVYAGVPGNMGEASYGHIWPNTSSFTAITTPDGKKIYNFTASGERWATKTLRFCGIGTICHEFTHSLGLPDIYPTNSWAFSICDDWDLMDGGNGINYGWCPPSFTPLEKMLLGWLEPIELTEAASITGLQAVSEGGAIYLIRHSDTEYLLLENRQQTKWDAGVPGHGLMVWYVDYEASAWRNNTPNNRTNNPRFRPVYADGLDYAAWDALIKEKGLSTYQNSLRMNNRHLSTSPYPYVTEETVVDQIADEYLTNIRETADGLVSFDFMGGGSGVKECSWQADVANAVYFDLSGCRVAQPQPGRLYLVRTPSATRKYLYR